MSASQRSALAPCSSLNASSAPFTHHLIWVSRRRRARVLRRLVHAAVPASGAACRRREGGVRRAAPLGRLPHVRPPVCTTARLYKPERLQACLHACSPSRAARAHRRHMSMCPAAWCPAALRASYEVCLAAAAGGLYRRTASGSADAAGSTTADSASIWAQPSGQTGCELAAVRAMSMQPKKQQQHIRCPPPPHPLQQLRRLLFEHVHRGV